MSVDVARLRGLRLAATRAYAPLLGAAGRPEWDETFAAYKSAYESLQDAVLLDLPALLDELDAARALLSEVRERGLSSFGDAAQRIDLTRRLAAFLES